MRRRHFVVLDRDGTVIKERNYLSNPEEVELIPGAAAGLRRLREHGLGLIIVTNQSAVGRGLFDSTRLEAIHERLLYLLREENVELDGIYACPHVPGDLCRCRKPEIGLVDMASSDLHFDPKLSFVIGDKPCDIELGQRVGATTILVLTGYGPQVYRENKTKPNYIVTDLGEGARVILNLLGKGEGTIA